MSDYTPELGDRIRVTRPIEGEVTSIAQSWLEVVCDDGTPHIFDAPYIGVERLPDPEHRGEQ